MQRKLKSGDCIDISQYKVTDQSEVTDYESGPTELYELPREWERMIRDDGKDFCDKDLERWIWSIGVEAATGKIIASTDGRFYQNEHYECIWLR